MSYHARHAARRPARPLARGLASVLAATALIGGAAVAVGQSAVAETTCTHKCYSAVVTPQSSPAGSAQRFSVTLTNLMGSGAQRLGSADITPPPGYTVTSVEQPTARGRAALVGNVVQLREIDLALGETGVFSFSGTTPAVAGTYAWTVAAKQANDFNGTGNNLNQDAALTDLTTTVSSGGGGPVVCPPGTVSCATTTIDYSKASIVSTGADAGTVNWLVGTMSFPATDQVGTQAYTMRASAVPGDYCPLAAGTVQCTYEMYIDPVPSPYGGPYNATLVLVCDVTKCPSPLIASTKNDEENGQVTLIPPCVSPATNGQLCWEQSRQIDGDLEVTYRNVGPGDPKIAGLTDSITTG